MAGVVDRRWTVTPTSHLVSWMTSLSLMSLVKLKRMLNQSATPSWDGPSSQPRPHLRSSWMTSTELFVNPIQRLCQTQERRYDSTYSTYSTNSQGGCSRSSPAVQDCRTFKSQGMPFFLLNSCDALVLLENCLSMHKLLYMLRTTDCSSNLPSGKNWWSAWSGLSMVLNVNLVDEQWLQASLPVKNGGYGIHSTQKLAPSAFLTSAASTCMPQKSILPATVKHLEVKFVTETELWWTILKGVEKPNIKIQHIQKAWNGLVSKSHKAKSCLEPR